CHEVDAPVGGRAEKYRRLGQAALEPVEHAEQRLRVGNLDRRREYARARQLLGPRRERLEVQPGCAWARAATLLESLLKTLSLVRERAHGVRRVLGAGSQL